MAKQLQLVPKDISFPMATILGEEHQELYEKVFKELFDLIEGSWDGCAWAEENGSKDAKEARIAYGKSMEWVRDAWKELGL